MLQVKVDKGSSIAVPPFGGKLSFMYKSKYNGKNKICQIGPGPTKDLYYAYFEEDDVDFEIKMNNTLCNDRMIRYEMEVVEKKYGFVVDSKKTGQQETLKSNGRKLHFIRQSGREGKSLISKIASSHGISVEDSSLLVSQIKFQTSYSKLPPYRIRVKLPGKKGDDKLAVEVDQLTTMAELKSKISQRIGHPSSNFIVSWKGRQEDDKVTLKNLEIGEDSQIDIISVAVPIDVEMNSLILRTLQMSSWDTIDDLKKKIEEAEGFPALQQKLVFEEKDLKNGRSILGESNITLNSKIQLTISNIFPVVVKLVSSNKVITVPVSSQYTVQDVCEKLEKAHGISHDSHELIYCHGKRVFQYKMLEDIGVADSSSKIFLVDQTIITDAEEKEKGSPAKMLKMKKDPHKCQVGESFTISLKLLDQTSVSLTVCLSETVEELKEKLEEKLGRPVEKLATIVKENEILLSEQNLPLEVYEIGENSEVKEVQVIQVFVKTLSGRILTIMCSTLDTVDKCKLLIEEREGIPPDQQRLVFVGEQLEDGRTLEDYNIYENCTISLLLRLRGGEDKCGGCGKEDCRYCQNSTKPNVSERGAITFGGRSTQTFSTVRFKEDESIKINPFTVELRLAAVPPLD